MSKISDPSLVETSPDPDADCKLCSDFFDLPEVRALTSNLNSEMIARRLKIPLLCPVFETACTRLVENDNFTFELDSEAVEKLPNLIHNRVQNIVPDPDASETNRNQYTKARNIGIVFSGGPAPGGHNVIAGIYDAATKANPNSKLYGFWMGPDGILENRHVLLNQEMIDDYRNLGGFAMIKTGRTKIDSAKKMEQARKTLKGLDLDALVIIGGDDSNTNAAFMAQELFYDGIQIIGVPKTIDGDVQVRDSKGEVLCAVSFGYYSAARAFAQEVSNLCTDCSSDQKYWHICKVMGRSASHLALEVALQTHANITLIGEDLADYTDHRRLEASRKSGGTDFTAYGMTLRHLSRIICDAIVQRAAVGKNFGVMVIPEGVLEFINEIQVFIIKLNTIIGEYNRTHDIDFHSTHPFLEQKREYLRRLAQGTRDSGGHSVWNNRDDELFNDLPDFFQEGLLMERDSHGNFQFSLVETDKVIMGLVRDYLDILKDKGVYKLGIERAYYERTLEAAGLSPDRFGPVLFRNYDSGSYLLVKENIISIKTLKQVLVKAGLATEDQPVPSAVEKIYAKSVPQFKIQTHFYGYDGRGSSPTVFDCTYTYNLGWTAFSLIANGATGQMAAIRNLEQPFSQWEPIGVPIAPLMHLEERNGRLVLVLEKSLVDLKSPAFQTLKAFREKWLAATPGPDDFRVPGPIRLSGDIDEDRPITLTLNRYGAMHQKRGTHG
ncbi:6-phosphofructokinase [Desulfatirhabdium butyrativorans]|uniref:6-phosphofructokinase n=1 Tax=Desulfatirhabdium butyrativorans TaxID=340467 RepID=UPI0003FC9D3A|nr:6-phosphofructokinase [Desulfatirhabdium butyrativorans]